MIIHQKKSVNEHLVHLLPKNTGKNDTMGGISSVVAVAEQGWRPKYA